MSIRNKCAIVGVGTTKFGKLPGISPYALVLEALVKAMEDAGLTAKDVDGVLVENPMAFPEYGYASQVAIAAGINSTWSATVDLGGATACGIVQSAAAAIQAGLCNTVVCISAEDQASGNRFLKGSQLDQFTLPYGAISAVYPHAFKARRHMHEYGTTSKQLGAIAVACRKHALLNPNAQMKKPMTLEDHQNSRFIIEPLHLFDCCLVTDGGAAVIVTSVERAKDMKNRPVYISGMGQSHHLDIMGDDLSGGKRAGEIAYRMAGVTPADIDLAEIYDCFTITALLQIEDYGFCKRGEGGPFVENGRLELGGQLPINTAGGLLSEGHLLGMGHVVEGVRQLRGECGERQVNNAEVALVTGYGGNVGGPAPSIGYSALILTL